VLFSGSLRLNRLYDRFLYVFGLRLRYLYRSISTGWKFHADKEFRHSIVLLGSKDVG
jgi:hypothetical protein